MMTAISLLSPALALLIILCLCIKNWKNEVSGKLKRLVIPFGMIFGTFGYSFRFFSTSNDLLSYFVQVDAMKQYNFGEVMARSTDGLYIQDSLFYFVSRCGNDYILPFIVGFVIYAIAFYVLFDMIERSKRKYRVWEVALLALIMIGILAPYTIILNTRCVLSYVLIALAVYRDLIQKKKNIWTLLLYIIPVGLHSSAIVIIAIRLLSMLLQKFEKAKWVILSFVLLFPTIVDFLYANVAGLLSGPVGSILTSAINKAHYYLHWTSGGWATQIESSVSSNLIKVFGTIFLILILILLFKKAYVDESKSQKSLYSEPMIGFLFLMAVFALGCLNIKTGAFWRFEAVVVLFSPVILVQAIDKKVMSKRYFHVLSIYAAALLAYNIVYQIKNLNATETVMNFLRTPGLKIMYELLKGTVHLIG